MALTEQEEFELLSLEREKALQTRDFEPIATEITEPSSSSLASMLKTYGIGAGVVAGAGYGLKKGYEFLRQPKVRTELKGVGQELKGIQQQIPSMAGRTSIEGTEVSFLPKRLNQVSQNLKQQLNTFDETMVSLSAKDLSETIKTSYPSWIKSATDTYGAGLDQLDTYFQNKPITAKVYADLLDDTINVLYKKGIPINQIKSLEVLRDGISPSKEIVIPFSQAKNHISNLVNQEPYSATSGILREKWGDFLEKNAPKEVSEKLGQLNKQYKTFSNARTQLSRVVDQQTGEFNVSKLNNYLTKYTRQRVDEGIVDLMKLLGEGSELTQPIGGVSRKFETLSKLRVKRFQNEDAIRQQIDKINSLRSKSEELISRGKVLQTKLEGRNVAKALTRLFGLGKKTIPFLSIIPQITDAVRFSKDPAAYIAALESGLSQEELIEARKKYQEGTMTEEEKIRYGLMI